MAEIFGSGSFGSGFGFADRPVLLGDLAVERVVVRALELTGDAFSLPLLRLGLAEGDDFADADLDPAEFDLRLRRR